MKYLTAFKFRFTYDFYIPVVTVGQSIDYVFNHSGNGLVLPAGVGGINLVTTQQLQNGGAIDSLKDAAGNELLTANGVMYRMYVNSSTPELNESVIVGWKHALRREQPRDLLALLEQLANS